MYLEWNQAQVCLAKKNTSTKHVELHCWYLLYCVEKSNYISSYFTSWALEKSVFISQVITGLKLGTQQI